MSLKRSIKKLEKVTENPVVLVAASWRPDIATDLDVQAARAFAELLNTMDADHITLVYIARGGDCAFADHAARSMRGRNITFDLAVPTLINGPGALLALAAKNVLVHPHGGVGAYDAGPLRNRDTQLGPKLFDDVPALGGIRYEHDLALPVRLAAGMRERRLSRAVADRLAGEQNYDALSHLHLGDQLGLDAQQLSEAGIASETWDEDALWRLYAEVEQALGLLAVPEPAYTEAELGDEVEFTPARGLTGALLESRSKCFSFELDTGSPDPDTGIYAGAWSF